MPGLEKDWQRLFNKRNEVFNERLPLLFDELEKEAGKIIKVECRQVGADTISLKASALLLA